MENKSEFNLDEFEKGIGEYFNKENPNAKPFNLVVKNTKWEENGEKLSMWNIGDGIVTGDGGAEIFFEAMRKEGEKILKNGK